MPWLAIHGVQHVMHPPTHITDPTPGPSFLVFITSGIERPTIEASLRRMAFTSAAE